MGIRYLGVIRVHLVCWFEYVLVLADSEASAVVIIELLFLLGFDDARG
jgi:hypothetical protein